MKITALQNHRCILNGKSIIIYVLLLYTNHKSLREISLIIISGGGFRVYYVNQSPCIIVLIARLDHSSNKTQLSTEAHV